MTYSTVRWADYDMRAAGLTIVRQDMLYRLTLSLWWLSIQIAWECTSCCEG